MCGRLYDHLRSNRDLEDDAMVAVWVRLVTELPWAGQDDREISRLHGAISDAEHEIKRLTRDNARLAERAKRLETGIRHAMEAVDIVSINESADLLRSHERGLS
jgi:hypothetical protein